VFRLSRYTLSFDPAHSEYAEDTIFDTFWISRVMCTVLLHVFPLATRNDDVTNIEKWRNNTSTRLQSTLVRSLVLEHELLGRLLHSCYPRDSNSTVSDGGAGFTDLK
jgi:hypothetical protein